MLNKIVVGIVSSVFMLACSVKDSVDADVTSSTDVVSSVSISAPETVKVQDESVVVPVSPSVPCACPDCACPSPSVDNVPNVDTVPAVNSVVNPVNVTTPSTTTVAAPPSSTLPTK